MKSILFIVVFAVGGTAGFVLGRNSVESATKAVSSERSPSVTKPALPTANPGPEVASVSAKSETKKTDNVQTLAGTWQVPSKISADWVRTARNVDRRYGVIYRICGLHPGEQRLVRELLTTEELLEGKRRELLAAGATEPEVQAALNEVSGNVAALQKRLDEQAPEVAQFLNEFKSHPTAAVATTEISERIMIETGSLTPNQLETIFASVAKCEIDAPVPAFASSLELTDRAAEDVAKASAAVYERNRRVIPEVCAVLDPAQVSAFMAYMEEQLLALREHGGKS